MPRKNQAALRQDARKAGMCLECFKRPVATGRVRCRNCLDDAKDMARFRYRHGRATRERAILIAVIFGLIISEIFVDDPPSDGYK